jgi:signal transduction histidine kinase
LVSDTVAMLRSAGVPRSVRLTLSIQPGVGVGVAGVGDAVRVCVDRTRIEQVLVNLIRNAVDALGEVRDPERARAIRVEVGADRERRRAWCAIEDSGCGIPAEALASIFDAYFTTKPPDRGTGLGLSVVKQIVESYSGSISVESKLGSGSKFKLELPLSA